MAGGVSVTLAEEFLVSCVDKAVIVSLCPLTGNRLCVLPVFELGITKRWHAVCLASGMLAVRAPCRPTEGSTFIPTPREIQNKKAIVNVQNYADCALMQQSMGLTSAIRTLWYVPK